MPIFINKQAIETFNFSGGECHVSIREIALGKRTDVTAWLYSSDDVMRLLLSVDAIRRSNLQTQIYLNIPYFPYARQDRVCNQGEALSVSVMAHLINSLGCTQVTIYDPHSDTSSALIKNVIVVHQSDIIMNSSLYKTILEKNLVLLAPDAGAEKKTLALAKKLNESGFFAEAMFATKVRDVRNGAIVRTTVPPDVAGRNFLVVDDICDGGRTFLELAKELKRHGARDLYLYITHGIFSKGLADLKEVFQHVYCFESFNGSIDSEFLTVLENK